MPLEDTLRKTLAAALREPNARSLRDVAKASGVPLVTLHDFLGGKGSMRLPQAEALAKDLGLTITIRKGAR